MDKNLKKLRKIIDYYDNKQALTIEEEVIMFTYEEMIKNKLIYGTVFYL